MNQYRHWAVLDGLRGWAILPVFLYHGRIVNVNGLAEKVLAKSTSAGWAGVDLFFVLSGFLITGILLQSKSTPAYFRNFFMRRVLRLFPAYYLTLIFFLFMGVIVVGDGQLGWHLFYLMNFYYAKLGAFPESPLTITWSLAVEEQFYLVWPALVFFLSLKNLRKTCFTLIVLAPIFRTIMWKLGYSGEANYVLPYCRMDALCVGGLIATYLHEGTLQEFAKKFKSVFFVGGAVSLGILAVNVSSMTVVMQLLGLSSNAILFGGILTALVCERFPRVILPLINNRVMRMFGKYSYGIYLYHMIIFFFLSEPIKRTFATADFSVFEQFRFYAITLAATLAVSFVSFHGFEKHFLKLKRFFPRQERKSDTNVARQPNLA